MRSRLSSNPGQFVLIFIILLLKIVLMRFFFYEGFPWSGLPAEALSALMLLGLFDLLFFPLQKKSPVYWCFNFVYSFTLFAATLYFAHFGTVPTYAVLSELHQVPQVRASVNALLRPEHFLFFADFALLLIAAVFRRIRKYAGSRTLSFRSGPAGPVRSGWPWRAAMLGILVVGIGGSALSVRAGQKIDNELVRAETVGFVNFQADAALRNHEEERMIAEGNIQETIGKIHSLQAEYPYRTDAGMAGQPGQPAYFGAARGMNLIVIQMESFQNFAIGLKVNGQEITPVLNGLIKEGFYFPKVFQQIGPGNTSDAEFMSNTSIYPTAAVAMSKGFGNRELPSLPRLLQRHGYVANTFHINDVTFWDRNRLYPALNFDKYYDKPFYENDHFNDFGASDEEMYRVGMDKLSELEHEGKPFYAQFVTTSSHSPFVVPGDRVKIQLPDTLKGTNLGNYLTALNYTDYAIGELIERLKEAGMWDHTMLAIYGDHFGIQPSETGAAEIGEKLGIPYEDRISRFNIPFIVHIPGQQAGIVSDVTGGQVDMMPTIANLLGVSLKDEKFTALGQDLLNIDRNVVGMRYYLPTGSFFNNEVMFVPGQGFEDGTAVSLKTLEPVSDITPYRRDFDYVTQLMKLSDEYVKLLPKRH